MKRFLLAKYACILCVMGLGSVCGSIHAGNPSLEHKPPILTTTAIIEIYDQDEFQGIVLIERGKAPFGKAIPGGKVEYGETVEQAVRREMLEEVNLPLEDVRQFHVYSDPTRDFRHHSVEVTHTAKAFQWPNAGDDAAKAFVIRLEDIPWNELAFDHAQVLQDYLAWRCDEHALAMYNREAIFGKRLGRVEDDEKDEDMKKISIYQAEKKIVGIKTRTNNQLETDPLKGKIFPTIQQYVHNHIAATIPHRMHPGTTLCIYTDYESDHRGNYTYFIGEEVDSFEKVPANLHTLIIPPQKYIKFTNGPDAMPDVVRNPWQQIWQMTPETLGGIRSYIADFEIYDERAQDPQHIVLDIYIGIEE